MNQDFPNTHAPPNVLYYLNSISQTIFITRILLTISNKNHLVLIRFEGDYPFEKIPIHRHGFLDVRSRDCGDILAVPAYNSLLSADRLFLGPQFGPFASAIHRVGKIQAVYRRPVSKEKHHEPGNDPDVRDDALCLCDPFCADRQRVVAHRIDNRILGPPDRVDLAFAVQEIEKNVTPAIQSDKYSIALRYFSARSLSFWVIFSSLVKSELCFRSASFTAVANRFFLTPAKYAA